MRDAIDGVRALLEILERQHARQELRPLRDALSQLQMAYAREAQAGGADERRARQRPAPSARPPAQREPRRRAPAAEEPGTGASGKPGAGPAESSGRLWVPGR